MSIFDQKWEIFGKNHHFWSFLVEKVTFTQFLAKNSLFFAVKFRFLDSILALKKIFSRKTKRVQAKSFVET